MFKTSRAVILQFLGIVMAGIAVFWATRHFPIVELVLKAQRKIGQMELWGAVLYPLLFAGCNLLLLPGGVIAMGGGLFFGLWWGFLLVLCGNLIGAAAAFQISRRLGWQWVEKKVANHRKWAALTGRLRGRGGRSSSLARSSSAFSISRPDQHVGEIKEPVFGRAWGGLRWARRPGSSSSDMATAQLGIKLLRRENPSPSPNTSSGSGGCSYSLREHLPRQARRPAPAGDPR